MKLAELAIFGVAVFSGAIFWLVTRRAAAADVGVGNAALATKVGGALPMPCEGMTMSDRLVRAWLTLLLTIPATGRRRA